MVVLSLFCLLGAVCLRFQVKFRRLNAVAMSQTEICKVGANALPQREYEAELSKLQKLPFAPVPPRVKTTHHVCLGVALGSTNLSISRFAEDGGSGHAEAIPVSVGCLSSNFVDFVNFGGAKRDFSAAGHSELVLDEKDLAGKSAAGLRPAVASLDAEPDPGLGADGSASLTGAATGTGLAAVTGSASASVAAAASAPVHRGTQTPRPPATALRTVGVVPAAIAFLTGSNTVEFGERAIDAKIRHLPSSDTEARVESKSNHKDMVTAYTEESFLT